MIVILGNVTRVSVLCKYVNFTRLLIAFVQSPSQDTPRGKASKTNTDNNIAVHGQQS